MNQYNDVLSDLQDYMLNEDNMIKALRKKIKPTPKENRQVKQNKTNRQTLFIPNQQDSLFWCFYIINTIHIFFNNIL